MSLRVFVAFRRLMHANRKLIAERLDVSRPTVTVMLKKMAAAGLVERRRDVRDA
ncbi:MAG: MarR family transcriptional regulator [Caldilineae bacterium]|nr:MarR family transcriptional regulator [Chloroflexota bacterium]MCB9175843.1 MarR family transcriptional regulator [Caldilineae bacterium]